VIPARHARRLISEIIVGERQVHPFRERHPEGYEGSERSVSKLTRGKGDQLG
jgi:hypothetical protein